MSAEHEPTIQTKLAAFEPRRNIDRPRFAVRDARQPALKLEGEDEFFRKALEVHLPPELLAQQVPVTVMHPPEQKKTPWYKREWFKRVRFVAGVFLIGVGVVWMVFPGLAFVTAAVATAVGAPQVALASATLGAASFLLPSPLIFALAILVGGETLRPVVNAIKEYAKKKAKQFGQWAWSGLRRAIGLKPNDAPPAGETPPEGARSIGQAA